MESAQKLRAAGRPTVPSLLSDELACNPFLRIDEVSVISGLGRDLPESASRVARFATLRSLKDSFRA
jgi:hydroxyacylglutathione hydrolase